MSESPTAPQPHFNLIPAKSRGWLVFFGVFSMVVGVLAIAFPLAMTIAVEQLIGIVCVVTGVFSVGGVLFGKETRHRVSSVILAIIRIVTGLALLMWIEAGVEAVTIVIAAFFVAEGIVFLVGAFTYQQLPKTVMIANGVLAVILGGMIFAKFPDSAAWAIGLLYGINALFYGASLVVLALTSKHFGSGPAE